MKSPSTPLWVILTFALLPLAACGDSRSDEQRLADAIANVEAQKYRDALIDLNSLLAKDPNDHNARLVLAETQLALGDSPAAEKELVRARDLGADPRAYTEAMARCMLARNAFAEVLAEIKVGVYADPAQAGVIQALRGYALLGLGSVVAARATFDDIIEREPGAEAIRLALLGQANLAKRNSDLPAAEALARRSLEIVPGSADSNLAIGQLLILQRKFAEAEAVFTRGRDDFASSGMNEFLLQAGLVEAFLGQRKIRQAATAVKELKSIRPEPPVSGYLKGRVALETGEINTAVEHLQRVLSHFPDYQPAQTMLGATSLERGDLELAQFWLMSAISSDPENVAARALLAETRLRMQRPEEALATLQDGLRNDADNPELLAMLGQTTAALGNREEGIRYLEQSLAAIPSLRTKLALASVYSAVGEADKATALIQSLPPDAIDDGRRRVLMIMSRFDRDDVADSLTKVESLVEWHPGDPAILLFAGSLYLQSGAHDKARQYLDRVVEIDPQNRGALLNLSRIDQLAGEFDASEKRFETYLRANPDDLIALLALAQIAARDGDAERAIKLLTRASNVHPDALTPHLGLAGLALQTGDSGAAARHARAAVSGHPHAAAAHYALGLYHLLASEPLDAIASLQKAVDLRPDSHVYHDYLARAQAGIGRLDDAHASFVEALRQEPGYLPATLALARLDIHRGNLTEAGELVTRLGASHADHPDAIEVAGDLHAARGRFDQAIAAYEAAHSIRPRSALVIKTYAVRSHMSPPAAADGLSQWLDAHPEDIPARIILAQDYQSTRHRNQAIEQYEMILKLQPGNALALNNLAWIYFETPGKTARVRALELSRRAHEIMPANHEIADTYGWILIKSGRIADGRLVLESALGMADPSSAPDVAYHLAAALQETGERDEAKGLLGAALATDKPFLERDDAQALHDSL